MNKKDKWSDIKLDLLTKDKLEAEKKNEVPDVYKDIDRLDSATLEEMSIPDKPKMLHLLFNYKQGKILTETYLENLKKYSEAQIENFRKRADNAIKANAANLDKALLEMQEASKVSVQEIINVAEESIQKIINKSLKDCGENFSDTLSEIKESDMHPEVKRNTIEEAKKVYERAITGIMDRRIIEFDKKHGL